MGQCDNACIPEEVFKWLWKSLKCASADYSKHAKQAKHVIIASPAREESQAREAS